MMHRWAVLGCLALLLASAHAEIKLQLAGQIHLGVSYSSPSDATGASYQYDKGVAEQMTADLENNILYVVGENGLMQVLDVSDSSAMKVLTAVELGGKATDVEVCGSWVAASIGDGTKNGNVMIYNKFSSVSAGMEPLYTLETGPLPDMIKFTKDCKMLFTANEGEGSISSGTFVNPEGSVSVFTWDKAEGEDVKFADLSKEPSSELITFTDIAGSSVQADNLWKAGVQWTFGPHTPGFPEDMFPMEDRTLVKALEPEYLALSTEEDKLFVCLQEASSIAVIDIESKKVEKIYPLKVKSWMSAGLFDASDEDGGINMTAWPVKGYSQPDSIVSFKIGTLDYIATANEGDAVEYCTGSLDDEGEEECYAGDTRGAKVVDNLSDDLAEDEDLVEALKSETHLGRLKLDVAGSLTEAGGKYSEIHALSTRSFSIYRAEGMLQVYDSGDLVEDLHRTFYPQIFNSDGADPGEKQSDQFDKRSDDKGPEVETLAVCEIDDRTLLFVGCERTSTVLVWDVTDPRKPVFQSIISVAGQDTVPADLADGTSTASPSIGVVDPEGMFCDAANKRLVLSGAVSGVVAIYDITGSVSAAAANGSYSLITLLAASVLCLFASMRF